MPQLEQLILSAPQGFVNTCLKLNGLSLEENDTLENIVTASWQQIQQGSVNNSDEAKAVSFIVKCMKQAQPPASLSATANTLASTTVLSKECIDRILIKVKELSSSEQAPQTDHAVHGKLSNLKWRIGVAVSSSLCKSIFSPYITLSFDVTDAKGEPSPVVLELTVEQFKEFRATFERVGKVMDSI